MKTEKVIYEADREERLLYERELMHKCLDAGLPEYVGDGKMRKQDVQIHLDTLEGNWEKLEKLSHFSWDEFMEDFWYLDATVRRFQTSIEALVDISRYVIRRLGLPSAQAYWEVPTALANAGYIDETAAVTYVQVVRFRNLIVHHYIPGKSGRNLQDLDRKPVSPPEVARPPIRDYRSGRNHLTVEQCLPQPVRSRFSDKHCQQ